MLNIAIKDDYLEVLSTLGDLEENIDLALRRYTVEEITEKIIKLRQKDALYKSKYKLDYSTFATRISEDEAFLDFIESNVEKMWEIDLADWEFSCKGIQDWTQYSLTNSNMNTITLSSDDLE